VQAPLFLRNNRTNHLATAAPDITVFPKTDPNLPNNFTALKAMAITSPVPTREEFAITCPSRRVAVESSPATVPAGASRRAHTCRSTAGTRGATARRRGSLSGRQPQAHRPDSAPPASGFLVMATPRRGSRAGADSNHPKAARPDEGPGRPLRVARERGAPPQGSICPREPVGTWR
jgi:hypothetical protein